MTFDALTGVLLIPAVAAALLAALPGYRVTAILNVLAALATFLTAASLFVVQPTTGPYLLVDDLNKVFIVLTTFVASRPACSARAISSMRSRSAG